MPRLTTEDILNLIYDAVAGGIGVEVHGTEDSSTLSVVSPSADGIANNANYWVRVMAGLYALAPDLAFDRIRTAMNAAPGLGALNVAPIGGDITLRASAVIGAASGTSTAVDNLGWIKALLAVLNVTVVPTGGTPTLDVYLQTQLPNGDWQDLAHFAQVGGSTSKQILAWEGPRNGSGTQGEGAALTIDHHHALEDAGLTASTVRLLPIGDSLRVKWVFAAGGSTGDYTFDFTICGHT